MKFWARIFAAGFAAAALLGAALLGVVYGAGALRLDRSFANEESDWSLQLTWIAFFSLIAVVGGAIHAAGQARLINGRVGVLVRIVAAVSAGLGAGVAIMPLTAYPAVNTKLSAPIHPALTITLTVAVSLLAGMLLASLIAGNPPMTTSVVYFGLIALILAAVSFADTAPMLGRLYLDPVRLGVLDITALKHDQRAYASMPILAFVVGIVVALGGRFRYRSRVFVAVSGASGPLVIALAYLISGPGSRDLTDQAEAYLGAMIAVVAGLLASTIIALLPPRRQPFEIGK